MSWLSYCKVVKINITIQDTFSHQNNMFCYFNIHHQNIAIYVKRRDFRSSMKFYLSEAKYLGSRSIEM